MKLGAYTACLHDKPLAEALDILRDLGLDSAEINSGGFLPAAAPAVDELLRQRQAPARTTSASSRRPASTLTALNCNGNPLHPDPEVAREARPGPPRLHRARRACSASSASSTMSGLPGTDAGARPPSWTSCPWDSAYLDARDYQWNEVAIPFWKDDPGPGGRRRRQGLHRDAPAQPRLQPGHAGAAGRPRSAPPTSAPRWTPATCSGRASTRSRAVEHLGDLVYNAAAKDTRINEAAKVNGVLDDRFGRVAPDEPGAIALGGRYTLSRWPQDVLLGLRRGRPRPRRRTAGPSSSQALAQGRPRHGGQHRARGPGARPDRGPALRRADPAAGRGPGLGRATSWPGCVGDPRPLPAALSARGR